MNQATTTIDFNYDKYLYQDDYEGEIIIFASDDIPEERQFELAAHYGTYDNFKKYLSTAVRLEGTDWNENYKCFESATFYDENGDSTTLPVNGMKLGIIPKLYGQDVKKLMELIEKIEEEDKLAREQPPKPVHVNIISPNGQTQSAVVVPMHAVGQANRNNRIYPPEAIQKMVEQVNGRALNAGYDGPSPDGAPISDILNMMADTKTAPTFSIRGPLVARKSEE